MGIDLLPGIFVTSPTIEQPSATPIIMSLPSSSKSTTFQDSLQSTPYEKIDAGKPPIPITVAPTPSSVKLDLHPSLRQDLSVEHKPNIGSVTTRAGPSVDPRRDSGLAPSQSTTRESKAISATDVESPKGHTSSKGLSYLNAGDIAGVHSSSPPRTRHKLVKMKPPLKSSETEKDSFTEPPEAPFLGISTEIPTVSFEDLTSPGSLQFSKRGSVLLGGRRVSETYSSSNGVATAHTDCQDASNMLSTHLGELSLDDETNSRRIRSMYENEVPPALLSQIATHCEGNLQESSDVRLDLSVSESKLLPKILENGKDCAQETGSAASLFRNERELAGGIEDWEDVNLGDVDRYGFISSKPAPTNVSSSSLPTSQSLGLHRVSTALQLASEEPRGRNRIGRSPSLSKSTRSAGQTRNEANSRYTRPLSSQSSYRSTMSTRSSRLRLAANRLPHKRGRRLVDEAGDMLTLPPGLADIAENDEVGKTADSLRKKEWEREAKWRKMAKFVKARGPGGGMVFSFETSNPKLIERTWKGIPDRWRATAWHSFLSESARKVPGSASDEVLIKSFHELLGQSSRDDVQIDLDVPRTISGHIMFRKRYRGGQRLLFRVLHCLSLYFPDTGYAQGMAALAATLLCYFDEEMTFVMLVRMWQLRGLERLYKSNFTGLMQALQEFENNWLEAGVVGKKLRELEIASTSYGTRWYLTVFNYSIPFPAQLRVWDVFLLLGDEDRSTGLSDRNPFKGQLDVLHATSAALIDATREILLDSDFENAMKVLTSWIPIKDEDMLLEVAKTEWREYTKRNK